MAERLGEIFIKKNLVSHEQLESALQEQIQTGEFLGEVLTRLGFVKEDAVLQVLAEQFNTRFVSLDDIRVNPAVIKLVPNSLVWEHKIMPVEMRSGVLLIAVANPLDMWPMSVLQERLNLDEVMFVIAKKSDIMEKIKRYYGETLS